MPSVRTSGRIFQSFSDGINWNDIEFPPIPVTALAINPQNPGVVLAAGFNHVIHQGGLYRYYSFGNWQALTFPDSTAGDSLLFEIYDEFSCIPLL